MYTFLRKNGRMVLSIFCVLFFASAMSVGISRLFVIKNIEVVGEGVSIALDEARLPGNLLFFPSATIRQQLLSANELAKDIQIRKKFPNTLVISVTRRTPTAQLYSQQERLVVDDSGIVIGNALSQDAVLPILAFDVGFVQLGQKLHDPLVLRALTILSSARSKVPIRSVTRADNGALQGVVDNTSILFPLEGDVEEQLATLQTLLTGFRIKGSLPTHIDLRFGKPIVTF